MSDMKTLLKMDGVGAAALAQHDKVAQQVKALANQKLNSNEAVEKAVSGFEALLLHQMFKSMWATVQETGPMGGESSNEAKIYRDMFLQAVSDEVAEGRGLGVKDFLRKELLRSGYASKE